MGKLKQLCHWGPIIALSIIGTVSVVTHGVLLATHPLSPLNYDARQIDFLDGLKAFAEYFLYLFWHWAILNNYFKAAFHGPGYVPLQWHPTDPNHRHHLQYCELCKGYKPPRSHHCRRCSRCCMKMDHHCPWINTCAGHVNQHSFILFLLFCPLGCIHSLYYLVPVIYRFFFADWYYQRYPELFMQLVRMPWWFFIAIFLGAGLAVGVIGAVGALFVVQFRQAVRNKTSIEDYIINKAEWIRDGNSAYPEFQFPYDLGWKQNLHDVFFSALHLDYLSWPLAEGSDHFDLTKEQLRQKRVKRGRATPFEIIKPYSGRLLPVIDYGCRIICCPPWPDEPFLKLNVGDVVNVTRAKGRWLYGELVSRKSEDGASQRGWFPEAASRMIVYTQNNDDMHQKAE